MERCEHCGEEHGAEDIFCPKTGKLRAEQLLPPHTMLEEKYLIGKPLGVGGMGAVFAATHTLLDKKVAIKVMLTSDKQAMARLVREARAASATGHPNITAVTDMGKTSQGALFVVMEYLEGQTLEALIRAKPLGPRRALRLIAQVLAGLDVVHAKGIIHRDLKPENLMVVRDDEGQEIVKILDFGISKVISEDSGAQHLTDTGLVMGTPLYMSPEQARGDASIGVSTDVYAAGAILYAMVCGRPPHVADTLAALIAAKFEQDPVPPSERDAALSDALDAIVLRALQRRPEDRYPSAAVMRDDVLALLGDEARLVPSAAAPASQDLAAADAFASLDAVASQDELQLVTLDEASRGSSQGASALMSEPARGPGAGRGAPPRAPRRAAAVRPIPTESDHALPQRPLTTAPREVDLDPVAASSSLDLADPAAPKDGPEAASSSSKKGRRVGGFPAEGPIAGVVYAGQARRRRWGPLRLLFWILCLGGLGVGGYWAATSYREGAFNRDVMVQIDTFPKGAITTVDGVRLVRQPLILRRSSREAQVVVKAPGYETARTRIRLDTDVAIRIDLVPLVAPGAESKRVTTPPGKSKHTRSKRSRRSKRHSGKRRSRRTKKGSS